MAQTQRAAKTGSCRPPIAAPGARRGSRLKPPRSAMSTSLQCLKPKLDAALGAKALPIRPRLVVDGIIGIDLVVGRVPVQAERGLAACCIRTARGGRRGDVGLRIR